MAATMVFAVCHFSPLPCSTVLLLDLLLHDHSLLLQATGKELLGLALAFETLKSTRNGTRNGTLLSTKPCLLILLKQLTNLD